MDPEAGGLSLCRFETGTGSTSIPLYKISSSDDSSTTHCRSFTSRSWYNNSLLSTLSHSKTVDIGNRDDLEREDRNNLWKKKFTYQVVEKKTTTTK